MASKGQKFKKITREVKIKAVKCILKIRNQ